VLLETETDTERRENVLAARFRDTERHTAGVGLIIPLRILIFLCAVERDTEGIESKHVARILYGLIQSLLER
jgi:hypothetical protein